MGCVGPEVRVLSLRPISIFIDLEVDSIYVSIMDNFRFDITAEGDDALAAAIAVAFAQKGRGPAVTHYAMIEGVLIFFWCYSTCDCKEAQTLPFKLDAVGTTDFARRWLAQLPRSAYGKEPDHDGSNGLGFRVFNEAWGHVKHHRQALLAVEPAWAWYGK